MKRFTLLTIFIGIFISLGFYNTSKGQLLLDENFSYTAGDLLTAHGWYAHSGGGTQAITVNTTGLTFPGYIDSGIGNAALVDNNGEDDNYGFTAVSSGVVYTAFMVNVTGVAAGYFFHLMPTQTSTTFRGKVFMDATNHFGVSVGSNTGTMATTTFSTGTTYLMVLKYEIVAGTTNDIVSLFIFDTSIPPTEPGTPTIGPLTDATQADISPANVALRQFNASQNILVDGIRIGMSWADLFPASAPTVQASNINFTGISTTGMTVNWTNGDGAKRIVKMNTTNSFTNPVDGTDPSANAVYGGSGEQVVYNNNGNSIAITGLTPSTTYWYRVYEYNGTGTSTKYLTTTATNNPNSQATNSAAVAPTITTPTVTTITNTTAVLGGTITSNGGSAITERGTVWKTSAGVTITDNKLAEGGTTVAPFSHTRSALPAKTHIYYKAYATNIIGTSLTGEDSFFTLANEPTSHVTGFTAIPGGTTSIILNWTTPSTGADGYLILQKNGATPPTGTPVDANGYIVGNVIGDGTVVALVAPGTTLTTTITGLSPATQYSYTLVPYAWDGVNSPTYNYYTAPVIPSASATTTGTTPVIYTWQGANNGLWTTMTNWNPTRFVVASNDILQFNDGTTKNITAVPTETIGQMIMSNNTVINLQSSAASVLTISGLAGTDFIIPAGCAMNMNTTNAITIAVATSATASISGSMTFSSTVNTAHRLTGADAGSIVFNSGSVFTAGTFFLGNAFGTGTANSVTFSSGSTYVHQAGSNPFVNNPPTNIVTFQTGSLYKLISNSTPSFSGKTYANFEMDATGQTVTVTGAAAVTLDNLTITNGTFNFNMTATPGHSIKGNIAVAAGGILNFSPASSGTVALNGTALQSISGPGPITTGANSILEINNSNGITLNNLLTVNGSLKLTNGLFTLGSANLFLGTTGTTSGTPSATSMIVATGTGLLQKSFASGFTGSFLFPVGDNILSAEYSPLTLNFISGTFAAGNYAAVNLVNAKYPTDPNFVSYLKRYWNISSSGITAFNYGATFQYTVADVTGTESQISTVQVIPTPYITYDLANSALHQLTASGLTSFGTFTGSQMKPTVVTTAATAVGANTATLNGTIKANNLSTATGFEYGLTTTYGNNVSALPATVTGNTVTSVSLAISGLTMNTTYHFRVVGTSVPGTSTGADMVFTTTCPIPSAAGTITGPTSVCCPGTGYVYTVPVIANAINYNWTLPAGAILTSGANTNSITVSFPAGSVSGNVSVFGSSICGNGTVSPNLAVTVNLLPVPTITGSASVCINSGYYTYTTEANMSSYTWAISSGGLINFGSGTNQITVSWITAGAQTVSVTYHSAAGCAAAAPTVKNVTVNPLPGPAGTITGIPSVCAGQSGVHYSTTVIANTTTYVWTLPAGATISSGSGTSSITVNFGTTAVSGNITVQGNNACGNGTVSPPYAVIVIPLPVTPGSIMGTSTVCEGDAAISYHILPITNATGYVWSVPPGAVIVEGINTRSIKVNFPTGSTSGNVNVYGTDFCGDGPLSPDFPVTVNPQPPAPVISASGNTLTSSTPAGNQWYFNGNPIPGAVYQTYVATQSGNYTCNVSLLGCTGPFSNTLNVVITGIADKNNPTSITVFPNPNEGQFTLSIIGTPEEKEYDVTVMNNLGVTIFQEKGMKVKDQFRREIDLRPAPNGIYTVIVRNDNTSVVRKIVINK
ncbi:MAG: T9SS type A sorting domain-containing protein [Bacteroidetes bacterium]|nr:T9SS type A sorting domain-containing protein [Bacteroidota bacterium]